MSTKDEKTKKPIIARLRTLRCTSAISPTALSIMAEASVQRKYSVGDLIWEAGTPGEFFVVVCSGLIEVTRFSGNDEENTMGVFGPSDVIGLSAFMKKMTYPGNARVLSKNAEIIKFYLRPALQNKNEIAAEIQLWIREMLLLHEQVLRDKIDILNAGSVEAKVFELLHHLIRRFGETESPLKHFIPIRLTRAQIGKLVNARVETVIRLFSKWQTAGFIQFSEKGIHIDNIELLKKSISKGK